MSGLIFIFIAFILFLQYLSYKKLQKVENKIEKSVKEITNFSVVLEEVYNSSICSDVDFKHKIFNLSLDFGFSLLEPDFLALYVYDSKTNKFCLFDHRLLDNANTEFILETQSKSELFLKDYLFKNKTEIFPKEEESNKDKFLLMNYFDSSLIVNPIKIDAETQAILVLYTDYNSINLNILKVIVDYVISSVKNIKLYKNLSSMSIDTIKTLGRAIDAKSHYTRKHTERVTDYAKEILKRLDLSKYHEIIDEEKFKHDVEYAAMLHDVGKIGISENILDKNDKLTEQEWDVMCTHPLIGEQIVSPISSLKDLAPLILHHHEKYDGTGYLTGLKGKNIPLGARILAVADAYDAMTSDRSYRKALSKEVAIGELKKHSGKQFDPDMVDVFLKYLEENGEKD